MKKQATADQSPGQRVYETLFPGQEPWEELSAERQTRYEGVAKAARRRGSKPVQPKPIVWWVSHGSARERLEVNSGEYFGHFWRRGHKVKQGTEFAHPREVYKTRSAAIRGFIQHHARMARHYGSYAKDHARRAAAGKKLAAYYRKAAK